MISEHDACISYRASHLLEGYQANYATVIEVQARLPGKEEGLVRFDLTVLHLGAALNDGIERSHLLDVVPERNLLARVLSPNGGLKTLGPWDMPVQGDVAILRSLHVAHEAWHTGLGDRVVVDAVRSFAGSCAYLLIPLEEVENAVILKPYLVACGFFEVLPGVMGVALDYVNLARVTRRVQRVARNPEIPALQQPRMRTSNALNDLIKKLETGTNYSV